jgi:hypothetical protein
MTTGGDCSRLPLAGAAGLDEAEPSLCWHPALTKIASKTTSGRIGDGFMMRSRSRQAR